MANKEIIAIYGVFSSVHSPQYGNLTPYVLSNYIYLNVLLAGLVFILYYEVDVVVHGNYGLDTESHIIGNILYLHHKIWCLSSGEF